MTARIWGAHAASRAGDDVLVIANFFFSLGPIALLLQEDRFGEDAETSTRTACAPEIRAAAQANLTT